MKKIYLFLILCCLSIAGYAQTAASYGLTATTGSFSTISGTGTAISAGGMISDNGVTTGISLGFNFVYCGTTYTTASASANGWFSLANSALGASPSQINTIGSLTSISSGTGLLMPLWTDLYGVSQTAYYQTTGTAGSRIFTMEWKNWSVCCAAGTAVLNFQVKLYEGTNQIEYWYGGYSGTVPTSSTIGICNSTSDFQTLPLGISTFSNTSFNATCSPPANGTVLRWCAPPPAITGGTVSFCAGTTTTLANTQAGGSWTSAAPSVATVNSGTGVVTGVTAGTATISYVPVCGPAVIKVVTVTATPTTFSVTGGGAFCAGSTGVLVGLNGSAGGVTYGLYNGATLVTTTAGSGAAISFGLQTSSGTYTVIANNGSCSSTMLGSATITVNPLPTQFAVTGGGAFCTGSAGANVGLASSTIGVNYQLYAGATPVGTYFVGTGSALNFGPQATTGVTYTVVATNATTLCSIIMSGGVTVTASPLPNQFTVTGTGGYCLGGTGVPVGLTGSNTGINYQLFLGGVGSTIVAGTGSALSFGNQTTPGTYTVLATNPSTTCNITMSGSATVTLNSLPTSFTVTTPGTGAYCLGGAGVPVNLNGSQTGVNYQLYIGGTPSGAPVAGTGTSITFGNQTIVGSYTVVATNATTGCVNNMFASVSVTNNPLPSIFSVTGGGGYCAGGTGVAVGLASSSSGINYSLYNGTTLVGGASGTGSAVSFGLQLAAGTYSVVATNPVTLCTSNMSGSVTVTINPNPVVFTVTQVGTSYCAGGAGIPVGLTGSAIGINYQLWRGTTLDTTVAGTGAVLSFGSRTGAGAYSVIAVNATTLCSSNMTGSATISINPLPTVYTMTGGGGYCVGTPGVNIGLSASNTGISYQLYNSTGSSGLSVAGTGGAISFGLQTIASARDSVVATNTVTGCTSIMSGNVPVIINPLPTVYTVTSSSPAYCSGSTGPTINLGGSQSGINYQLYNSGSISGGPSIGTGGAMVFGPVTSGGTYSIIATNTTTGCTNNMTGTPAVVVNSLPVVFAVTGGGNYCSGTGGVHVGLALSAGGVTYQLYNGGVIVPGASLAGTGSALDFGFETANGTYTVVGTTTIGSCTSNMSGSAIVSTLALPTAYTITQSAPGFCAGGAGVTIGLSNSTIGINYQLYNGVTPAGAPMAGTGSSLSFGLQGAGTYTIVGTNIATGCLKTMTGVATVTATSLPVVHNVTGGGSYCPGTTGVDISIDASDAGVNYQLYNGLTPVGGPVAGIAATSISFGLQTTPGIYTVVATNTTSSCVSNMAGSATVAIYPLPIVYNISGGGNYCSGGTGVNIGLSGSNIGISYQLMNGGTTAGPALMGTGLALNFGLQTTTGGYTVVATNLATGCSNTMNGTATVGTNALPNIYNITGSGSYCAGGAGLHVYLSNSDIGTVYQLVIAGTTPVGILVAGTGSALDFGAQTTAGTYSVVATNTATTCTTEMSGMAVISINTLPSNTFTVSGGGAYCSGDAGLTVLLSGSDVTATYRLYNGTTAVGPSIPGGGPLIFGPVTGAGTYTVLATNTANTCTNLMTGSATISINPLPNHYLVTGGGAYCTGGTGVHVNLSGSNSGINYQVKIGSVLTGPIVAGTGMGIDMGLQTTAGVYTIQATNAGTGCTRIMTGSVNVSINPLPVVHTVVSTSSSYCAGGSGVAVSIDGSDTGISYQLYNGTTTVGFPRAGTGLAVGFGSITFPGSYTIVATNNATGCFDNMAPGVTVTINSLPVVFAVTGGGSYCAGGTGVHVGLAGSATGIRYKLYLAGVLIDSLPGTGTSLDFGLRTAGGTYTIVGKNTLTTCENNMSGSAVVVVKSLPGAHTITGGGAYCSGGAGVAVNLNGTDLSINYQLFRGGSILVGSPVSGTGTSITFGMQTVAGTYSVVGTSTITGCSNNMTGGAVISVNTLPSTYSVTGGGSYCPGGAGVNVGVSGSNTGVNYRLYKDGIAVGTAIAGTTGSPVNFGLQTAAGVYTVVATDATTACTNNMSGSTTVVINTLPIAYNVVGGGNYCVGGTGVSVGLSNSEIGVNYTLYAGISTIITLPGTGGPLDFGPQTLAGTYTVLGTSATTSCTHYMTGSVTVTPNPIVTPSVNISSTGGDTICSATFTTFTAVPTGGGLAPTFQWAVNGTPSSTGSSYGYIPTNGDVVTVTLTSSEACAIPTTATANLALTVDPKEAPFVTVSADPGTEVCQGTVVTFTAAPNFGGSAPTYVWFKAGVNFGTGATFSYTPADADVVYCVMTSNYHCRLANTANSNHLTMKVDVPTLPVVIISANPGTNVYSGQAVTLNTTVVNAGPSPVYQWFINGVPVAGATNASFSSNTFNNLDSVTCQVTSSGGCSGLLGFNSVTMHVITVGVKPVTLNGSDIALVPNPNNGQFTLKGSLGTNTDEEIIVEAVNMLGQVVYSQKMTAHNGDVNEHIQLDNSLANGMYLLNLRSGTENKVFHFVVEK